MTLFRNKRLMLDERTQRNALKFAIFLEYENPNGFSFRAILFFPLMNSRHILGEKINQKKTKNKKD